jgi:hypothetical protein
MLRSSVFLGIASTLSLLAACSARPGGNSQNGSDGTSGSAGQGASDGGTFAAGAAGNIGGSFGNGGAGAGQAGASSQSCSTPEGDDDGDGFAEADGDCNDCDPNVNPGAIEVINAVPDMNGMIPPKADEDCDGTADNAVDSCDDGLALGDTDPFSGAKAIELCQKATADDKKWGVTKAAYVRADGSSGKPPKPLQYGLKKKFGNNVNPQGGQSLLVLSAGYARDVNDPNKCGSETCSNNSGGNPPAGFPQDVPGCDGVTEINDDVALDLRIRTPTNATGYSFNFKFYTFEFPEYICTEFNDQFIALVDPAPMGSIKGNISFDSKTNPVSVNIAFFDVCDTASKGQWGQWCEFFGGNCPPPPNPYCPSGKAELAGTGFDAWAGGTYAGGTTWLKTQAPVTGGEEITVRFAIWDTGDNALDSTAIIDNFRWIANGGTVSVGTVEEPEPK